MIMIIKHIKLKWYVRNNIYSVYVYMYLTLFTRITLKVLLI